ncbi:hypothetical protein ABZ477_10310 [Microbacterium sp. NPDC019599]|uniref:hypothetical protein n=1 Tax=Microbacterium sp. NPDC019599 TaxID=3154690 RepID=UPI0033D381AF
MFFGLDGFLMILVIYGGALAVIGAVLYLVVRLGVGHALKAHTRWVDQGKP